MGPSKSGEQVRLWGGVEWNNVLHIHAVAVSFITAEEHVFLLAGNADIFHTPFGAAQAGILVGVF